MAEEATQDSNIQQDEIAVREISGPSAEGWKSQGSELEIAETSLVYNRPFLTLSVAKPRREFGTPCRFSDRDAHDSLVECRPFKDPNFEIRKFERESGVQAILASKEIPTQTTWFRPANMSVQYAPMTMQDEDKEYIMTSPGILDFMGDVYPRLEEALLQNITMDIFSDDYTALADEDSSLGNKSDNQMKEFQSFTDLVYSKNKSISCIDWQPNNRGVVAVACTEHMIFDKRVETSGKVQNSVVLIWNFADPIHPQFVLESPSDVICFKFNPTMPHIIVGGCMSGQVIMWDISSALEDAKSKGRKKVNSGSKDDEEAGSGSIPVIKNTFLSTIEHSHQTAVTDLRWIQPEMEILPNNTLGIGTATTSFQFVTTSADGQLLFWDLRMKGTKDQFKDKDTPWIPQHKIMLNRIEGSGEYAPTKALLGIKSMLFYVTTEDGEMLFGDWSPPPPRYDELTEAKHHFVKNVNIKHCGPIVDLQRSPFFPEILLTVGDWSFNLWKEKLHERPILSSSYTTSNVTAGRWSPTRPGVLFIAKSDGSIEIWDFLDRSHEPSMKQIITSVAITSIDFAPSSRGKMFLSLLRIDHLPYIGNTFTPQIMCEKQHQPNLVETLLFIYFWWCLLLRITIARNRR
eukprot:TRINITY_DN3814_c0_g3_i2.p1 TRINITY_DN3814_c0_g3~~TRINITY_DN3814_c0_g3_i2.p1  ORF type:complete len:630 (+),score=129.61 TRINITY_DN3814_c0_g3_i2:60-1949(+)